MQAKTPARSRPDYALPKSHEAFVRACKVIPGGVNSPARAFGGVGGHPAKVKYGGGFTGNVCTEDLVSLFESMGIDTGIDTGRLLETAYVGVATQYVLETRCGNVSVYVQNSEPGAAEQAPSEISWSPDSTFVVDSMEGAEA